MPLKDSLLIEFQLDQAVIEISSLVANQTRPIPFTHS
jgi:hypothetical protein